MKKGFLCLFFFGMSLLSLNADDYIFSIPGVGDVTISDRGGHSFTVTIPESGTYQFRGYVHSEKDFDLAATLPVGDIPVMGKLLDLFGLNSAVYRLRSDGLGVTARFENGGLGVIRGPMKDSLSSYSLLRNIADEIIGLLEIENMDLTGQIINNKIRGEIKGTISLAGIRFGFSESGDLSAEAVIKAVVVDLPKAAMKYLSEKSIDLVIGAAKGVANEAADLANAVYDEVREVAHDVSSSISHADHSLETCVTKCVPDYAYPITGRMLSKSNTAALEAYLKMGHRINLVYEGSPSATKEKRQQMTEAAWAEVEKELDSKWKRIYNDDEVDNYFFKDSSEKKGRAAYREIIQREWNYHKKFRKGLKNNLLFTVNGDPMALLNYWALNRRPVIFASGETPFLIDLANASYDNGANVGFYEHTGAVNQMWYLQKAETKDTYYIQSAATGKYIHIQDARDTENANLLCWAGKGARQTKFKAAVDSEGYFVFTSVNGYAFTLQGGDPQNGANLILTKEDGAKPQKFSVFSAPIIPDFKAGEYRLVNGIKGLRLTAERENKDGANVYLARGNNSDYQKFILLGGTGLSGRQTWHIYNIGSGRYVHLKGGNRFWPGVGVLVWSGFGGDNTKYFFEKQKNGEYIIRTKRGNILESENSDKKTKDGSNVCIYWDKYLDDQRWFLELIREY